MSCFHRADRVGPVLVYGAQVAELKNHSFATRRSSVRMNAEIFLMERVQKSSEELKRDELAGPFVSQL